MNRARFGIPNRESLSNCPPFSSLSDGLDLHYNGVSSDCLSPPDAMPSNRPNLTRSTLKLDVQSFQDLLSAAFTIQEHNDNLHQAHSRSGPEASCEAAAPGFCQRCGAPNPADGSPCENCDPGPLRPGERLQRNWASMWLMSQEQGLWPERSPEISEPERTEVPPPELERRPRNQPARAFGASGILALPLAKEVTEETIGRQTEPIHERVDAKSALTKSSPGKTALDHPALPLGKVAEATEELATEDSDSTVQTFQLSASADFFPEDTTRDATRSDEPTGARSATSPLIQRLADLRVILRFHRADLYLGAAVFLAVFALLWPAATSTRQPTLGVWDRTLITLGIAEAPAPVVHLQGDPGIEVWIDPHTALYYCPGEELYGKAAGGRLTSQHEAQMDRFEPANRSACE